VRTAYEKAASAARPQNQQDVSRNDKYLAPSIILLSSPHFSAFQLWQTKYPSGRICSQSGAQVRNMYGLVVLEVELWRFPD
jgi:hypothetical protein